MTEEQQLKVAKVFDTIWRAFIDGGSFDSVDIHEMLVESGLTKCRLATEDEAQTHEVEEGEKLICLNADGLAVVAMAREYTLNIVVTKGGV